MKIAIMTVPFNNNYGGFLQAFALKHTLQQMGHEVIFVMRRRNRLRANRLRNLIRYILHMDNFCQYKYDWQIHKLSKRTNKFVNKYLKPWTKEYYTSESLKECRNLDADVFIAGSDQCWRHKFAPGYIDDYFFKFLKGTNKKRISYAASFGTEDFEFSPQMQQSCTELLKEFSALSVRESSGIDLLENYFAVPKGKAIEVLDPTFLPTIDVYKALITDYPIPERKYVFTYILDEGEDKRIVVERIKKEKNLIELSQKAQTVNPYNIYSQNTIEPIELWLSRIYHADFVVTDSFHGTVFCILFNKPFIVYGNPERGSARFQTLLSKFRLEDRYIDTSSQLDQTVTLNNINWDSINSKVDEYRNRSLVFLIHSLINNEDLSADLG